MSQLLEEAKSILTYAFREEREGNTYFDGTKVTARGVLASWYSDEHKSAHGCRNYVDADMALAFVAVRIARLRIWQDEEIKWEKAQEARLVKVKARLAKWEEQEEADHAKATAEAMTATEWTIGDLVQL